MSNLYDIIPGLREAVEKENLLRDASFVTDYDLIGGYKVHSLTPRLVAVLQLMKCPLICGGKIELTDILKFLWVIKVKEHGNTDAERNVFRDELIKTKSPDTLMQDITDYLNVAYMDFGGGSGDNSDRTSYVSSMANVVDFLASEYGWQECDILDMPYRRISQYIKAISIRNNPSRPKFNPSDKVKSDFLNRISS